MQDKIVNVNYTFIQTYNIDMPKLFFISALKPLIFKLSESVLEYEHYQIFNIENRNYIIK